jgi:hypothetical protein
LGVETASRRSTAEDIVTDELARLGHDAQVVSLRFKTLTLSAGPQTAAFLRYDLGRLRSRLDSELPGVVSDIKVQVVQTRA